MSEISNGRFETVGFADWTQYPGTGTITQTNVGAEVYCGTYAAKLARGATDVTELYQRLSSPLSDRRYVLSAYTRGDGGDGAARIEIYDVTHDVAIGTYYPDNHSATYAFYRCDFAIPQGCNDIDIVLGVEIASTTAYFDDVLVTFEGYFIGGWDDGVVYGAGQAHKWMIYQAENETRLTVTKNPRRTGQYGLRVELHEGDAGQAAFLTVMQDQGGFSLVENENSGTKYVGYSVMLEPNWVTPAEWSLCFQLHGPDPIHCSPGFALCFDPAGVGSYFVQTYWGPQPEPGSKVGVNYTLADGSLRKGHWVDWVIRITFAKLATGSFQVWRRDENESGFRSVLAVSGVSTLQYSPDVNDGSVDDHYYTCGLYREPQALTNVLWLDGMCRGDNFDWVVQNAFPIQDRRARGRGGRR